MKIFKEGKMYKDPEDKNLVSVCCGVKVERLPNEPEMGDGYAFWRRYRCKKCGRTLDFREVRKR